MPKGSKVSGAFVLGYFRGLTGVSLSFCQKDQGTYWGLGV